MKQQLAKMFIVTVFSLLFGAGVVILFSHAVNRQAIIMQEGY